MEPLSNKQKQFLRKQRHDKVLIHVLRFFIFGDLLILWETAAQLQWIDSFIFSSPSRVLKTFVDMYKNHALLHHIGITLTETLISFALVILISLACAILLWIFPRLSKILEPYLVVLNSLPKSALAPLLIVWLGANMRTIIVAGISVAVFGSIMNIYTGFQEVDTEKLKLIRTLGGGRREELSKIVLPSSIPLILSIMKVNIGLCLVGVIIGEFIGAREGLGYLIIYSSQTFKLDWVILSIAILCIIAVLLYGLLNFAEKRYLQRY
ncbi:MAG: ABC transporter permease [Eubacteriales bacterium]|nr:ABC transporter permease [Eubacteriales bacterium]